MKRLASSGRCRPAAMNFRVCSPICWIVMVPLRSWSRKLNPAAAPKPAKVGMLNGKMTASGMAANCLCSVPP